MRQPNASSPKKPLALVLVKEASYLYHAALDGKPIGAAWVRSDGGATWVEEVKVLKRYRRRGVATALYGFIEQELGLQLRPSTGLNDDAFAFWCSFRPEAVKDDLRHRQAQLLGRQVLKNGRQAVIYKACGLLAEVRYLDMRQGAPNSESTLRAREVDMALLPPASGDDTRRQLREDFCAALWHVFELAKLDSGAGERGVSAALERFKRFLVPDNRGLVSHDHLFAQIPAPWDRYRREVVEEVVTSLVTTGFLPLEARLDEWFVADPAGADEPYPLVAALKGGAIDMAVHLLQLGARCDYSVGGLTLLTFLDKHYGSVGWPPPRAEAKLQARAQLLEALMMRQIALADASAAASSAAPVRGREARAV